MAEPKKRDPTHIGFPDTTPLRRTERGLIPLNTNHYKVRKRGRFSDVPKRSQRKQFLKTLRARKGVPRS